MCGRFTMTPDGSEWVKDSLGASADATFEEQYRPRWNIAPMQPHWIARAEHEARVVLPATWGLVRAGAPAAPGGRPPARPINVRAESVVKGAFRAAFDATRCVVPADGFFEWTGGANARRPFWFHRPDGGLFVFAGLYSEVAGAEGEPSRTFTILTTEANRLVAPVHDRMPVILLDDDAIEEWLYAKTPPQRLHALLRPLPDEALIATPVSTRVNSVANDDPACLAEAEPEMQAPLL